MGTIISEEQEKVFRIRLAEYNERFPKYVSRGLHYGYPTCCIVEFCFRMEHGIKYGKLWKDVSKTTGFVPCLKHAQAISKEEITIESLISSERKCRYQFPTDEDDQLPP